MLRDRLFLALERIDDRLHERGRPLKPLCRLVGMMEPGFYERTTDWENPLFVRPGSPEFARFADRLCEHGYREGCPDGCARRAGLI